MDHNQRAELCRGSVDFVVPKDYWVQSDSSDPATQPRPPAPLGFIFAVDVSWSSVRTGVLDQVLAGIRQVLYGDQEDEAKETLNGDQGEAEGKVRMPKAVPKGARVAIMTFDKTVHFYNLSVRQGDVVQASTRGLSASSFVAQAGLETAQMLVVPDLEDMFVPMSEGLLVDPYESRSLIESLLDNLPNMFAETQVVEAALGGPVGAALQSLVRRIASRLCFVKR